MTLGGKGPSIRIHLFLALAFVLACLGVPAAAASTSDGLAQLAPAAPVIGCANLQNADLRGAVGAKVTITRAVETSEGSPRSYCRVTGTIARAINFEVRLPTQGWTQRFLQTGCGGLCGGAMIHVENAQDCAPTTDGTIVLATDDMGHQGMGGAWGENQDQREDFAYRGNHVTALAAKALIRDYYGRAPRYSYFSGCSDGGREALIEAERYPQDFDGIAAGAPALNFTVQNSFHHGWLARVNTAADGHPLLSAIDIQPLHTAVLKACDGLDGLVDGQITDPRRCHFDPAKIRCPGAYQAGLCLTDAQVTAVRSIYDGARDASGKRLEIGPLMPGSELKWIGVFVPHDPAGTINSGGMALGTINHLLFTPNPDYTIAGFPFTAAMFVSEDAARRLYNADDPDLAPFAAHGGRLILYHGWADGDISPLNTIDYYERVGRALGRHRRDGFVRMFLLPGMGHCGGGEGPSVFPLLAGLMAWVESGHAPEMMIAHRRTLPAPGADQGPGVGRPGNDGPPPEVLREQQRSAAVEAALGPRSRPIYAYPLVARYNGTGPIDDATSFVAATPAPVSGISDWIGAKP